MRSIPLALICAGLVAGAGLAAQGSGGAPAPAAKSPPPNWQTSGNSGQTSTLGVSPLATAVSAPGARILLARPVGKLEAGDVQGAFTALIVEIPAGGTVRGLRLDLARPGVTDTIYLEEAIFPKLQEILLIYASRLPGPWSVSAANPNGLLWNQLSDINSNRLHGFSVAAFYDPATGFNGLIIGRFPKVSENSPGVFEFPKVLPMDLAGIIKLGIEALNAGTSAPSASREEQQARP